jgi:geranylgeranyl diphosphate synthase type I
VELVHNFSLVFDDVQDGDPLRRGRPSVWKVWGVEQAINAGAALEALVSRAVVDLLPPRNFERTGPALVLLTDAMLALCRGQVLDLQFEQRVEVKVEEYLAMIALKTARLFEVSARLGALSAGVGTTFSDRAERFGHHLGMAYQIIDDIAGVWGSPGRLGKPVGSDLRNGKKTLPTLIGLRSASASGRRQLRSLLTHAHFQPPEVDAARSILAQADAHGQCLKLAAEHLAEARLNLFAMAERPNWALRALGDMVTSLEEGMAG